MCPAATPVGGPSPRARGSLAPVVAPAGGPGSIPASAGEPRTARHPRSRPWVHPRERGGARWQSQATTATQGPSPRARGSPRRRRDQSGLPRSIPASAGEPAATAALAPFPGVHPRERGGAVIGGATSSFAVGPSPRARGSPTRANRVTRWTRSIPASAGEPPSRIAPCGWRRVHPRERGGAALAERTAPGEKGPSPRARGSPPPTAPRGPSSRSIPASAGEPSVRDDNDGDRGVHPRERGGALTTWVRGRVPRGPSPRARGSLRARQRARERTGSIPASAGEPTRRGSRTGAPRVHPRERGGARSPWWGWRRGRGPSPRARGSRTPRRASSVPERSIPASAGEPSASHVETYLRRVHPRERGGASRLRQGRRWRKGPSPRARGSPFAAASRSCDDGSIPASAGEPW